MTRAQQFCQNIKKSTQKIQKIPFLKINLLNRANTETLLIAYFTCLETVQTLYLMLIHSAEYRNSIAYVS